MRIVMKWIAALACLAGGWWMFHQAPAETDTPEKTYQALGWSAGGIALTAIAAGFCVVPIGRWMIGWLDVLFMPSGGGYTPPALYKLPEYYIREGRYADALAEYEKIQKHHPRDLAAYEGRLYVLQACMGHTALATKMYQQARRRVGKEQHAALDAYWAALQAGTATAPEKSLEE